MVVGGEADGSRLLAAVKLGTPFATFPTRVPDYSFYRLVWWCTCTAFHPTPSAHLTSPEGHEGHEGQLVLYVACSVGHARLCCAMYRNGWMAGHQ